MRDTNASRVLPSKVGDNGIGGGKYNEKENSSCVINPAHRARERHESYILVLSIQPLRPSPSQRHTFSVTFARLGPLEVDAKSLTQVIDSPGYLVVGN